MCIKTLQVTYQKTRKQEFVLLSMTLKERKLLLLPCLSYYMY